MSINKLSNLSHASLKSYLSEVGGRVLPRALSMSNSRIRMEQSVDALSLKDVQLGLENGQKPTSGKSDSGHSSQGC